ncbi:MAG: hypothetical protein R2827_03475 [Bdellovibrionales bacterium]
MKKILTWFLKVLDPTLEPHGEMRISLPVANGSLWIFDCKCTSSKGERRWSDRRHYQVLPSLLKIKGVGRGVRESNDIHPYGRKNVALNSFLKRRILGTINNTQYQNDVEAMKGKFKIDWFKYFSLQSQPIRTQDISRNLTWRSNSLKAQINLLM